MHASNANASSYGVGVQADVSPGSDDDPIGGASLRVCGTGAGASSAPRLMLLFQQTVAFSTSLCYRRRCPRLETEGGRMVRARAIRDRAAQRKPLLSRREQEVLDAAVRTTLRILVAKGHLRIEQDGPRYDYWPTVSRQTARRSALQHVLRTFFGGSTESALATLLDIQPAELDDATRQRLKELIDRSATEGR
jgi:predicted transcriptional regulator